MTSLRRLALDESTGLAWLALGKLPSDDFGRLVSLDLFELSASDCSEEQLVLFLSARLLLLNEGFNNVICDLNELVRTTDCD